MRNINMHAVIGAKLDLLFKMDTAFIDCLPVISPKINYVKNGVLTIAGMIVILFSMLDDKAIHEKEHVSYAGTFATRWGALIWEDNTKWQHQNNKKRFAKFFRNSFQTSYDIVIREASHSTDVLQSIFGNKYNNLQLHIQDNKQEFAIDLYGRTRAKGLGCSGIIEHNGNKCTLTINAGSNWGSYFEQQYILQIDNIVSFIELSDSVPPFMLVAFLHVIGVSVYNESILNQDTIEKVKKLNKAKFYRDKSLSVLLAPSTKADIREISKASAEGLINAFLNFEEKVVFKEDVSVYTGYSKLAEAVKVIHCPLDLADRLVALRNFSAHAYLFDDYIIGKKAYKIDLEFILSTLKEFVEFLFANYGKTSDFNYFDFFNKKVNLILNRLIGVKYKRIFSNSIKLFFRQENLKETDTVDAQVAALNMNFGVIDNSILCRNIENKYFFGKKYTFVFHKSEFKQQTETEYSFSRIEKIVLRFNEDYEVNNRKGSKQEIAFFRTIDYEKYITICGNLPVYTLVAQKDDGIVIEKIYDVRRV